MDGSGQESLWLNTQGHRGDGAVINTPAGLLVHFFLLLVHSRICHTDINQLNLTQIHTHTLPCCIFNEEEEE